LKSLTKIFLETQVKEPDLTRAKYISPTGRNTTSGNTNIRAQKKRGYQFKSYTSGDPFKKNIKQKKQSSTTKPKKLDKTIPIAETFTIQEMI
jgi:hypothetical protein